MSTILNVSPKGIDFICSFEGFRAQPYQDSGGVWTVGFGQTLDSQGVAKYAKGITEQQAKVLLAFHLDNECIQLRQLALGGLNQTQIDAIVSLTYNIGFEAFSKSTVYNQIMTRAINLESWELFIKDQHGNTQEGLVTRRRKELQLFIYGQY